MMLRRKPAMDKVDLKEMTVADLEAFCLSLGEPAFRGRQVFRWMHRRAATSFAEMTDLAQGLRSRLEEAAFIGRLEILCRQEDPQDGTAKYLFGLADGESVEGVLLRHRHGNTACVSTQVGCRMGCLFCASTIGGMVRNLTAGEMCEQVLAMFRDLRQGPAGEEAGRAIGKEADRVVHERVSHVVLMGMGEPLDNYDNVLKFLRLIHDPAGLGISYRNMTLSTCGVVPGIARLAGEGLPITLAVSLHAPNDELRNRLVPSNRRYPLQDLIRACRNYARITGRRVTYEYALIAGVNDQDELARELARLLRGKGAHVNLIPLNPSGRGLRAPDPRRVESFQGFLARGGINVTVRRSLGGRIEAACGQLRRRRLSPAGRGVRRA